MLWHDGRFRRPGTLEVPRHQIQDRIGQAGFRKWTARHTSERADPVATDNKGDTRNAVHVAGTGSGSRRTSADGQVDAGGIGASISSQRQVEDGVIDSAFIDDQAVIVPPSSR